MYVHTNEFPAAAAVLLGVDRADVENAMQIVDLDADNGHDDQNPFPLGCGAFCGPTSGEWISANGYGQCVTDGFYTAAAE